MSMKFSMSTTTNATTTTGRTLTSCQKKTTEKVVIEKKRSIEEENNITIRLSDLGIIKRTPTEQELQIQADRVLYILDKTYDKLQIAVCLPRLLRKNACLLRRYVQEQEVEFIQSVCIKYVDMSDYSYSHLKKCSLVQTLSTVIDKISMVESKKRGSDRVTTRDQDFYVDPHMAQVMELLWNNKQLRHKVLKDFPLIKESPPIVLVGCLKSLREVVEYKLSMTAVQERDRERQLRKAWKANAIIEDNIEKVNQQLHKQREDLGRQLENKNAAVSDYLNKIDLLKAKFKDEVRHKIQDSEREMSEDTSASELRQVDLSAESKATVQQYESLLTQHLNQEKGLRAKRFKVETQLSSWLAKYDADIGERQAEFEEITKGYEEEKAETEALQEKFDEQEEEYVVLMAEKEEEEQRIWEERAYLFLQNRSARKIQRCWRAYRQRKIDRKKAKKAKGKAKKQKSTEGSAAAGGEGGEPKPSNAGKKEKGGKDKKGKGKGKGKDKKSEPSEFRGGDPLAALENKFGGALDDLQGEEFSKKEVVVDLSAEPAGVTGVQME